MNDRINVYVMYRIDYIIEDDGIPKIIIFARDLDKKLQTLAVNFQPYFYVDEDEPIPEELQKYIDKVETGYTSFNGHKVKKLYVRVVDSTLTNVMSKLRKAFRNTYESHIFLTRRFLIDKNLKSTFIIDSHQIAPIDDTTLAEMIDIPPRNMYIDIEALIKEQIDINNPQPILCITVYDTYTDLLTSFVVSKDKSSLVRKVKFDSKIYTQIIFRFPDERSMLNAFINFVDEIKPDNIIGYNSSGMFNPVEKIFFSGFDLPYLINRCRLLKLPVEKLSPLRQVFVEKRINQPVIRGVNLIDLLYTLQIMVGAKELLSWKLDEVYAHYFGIKVSKPLNFDDIDDLLNKNTMDVIRSVELDKYLGISEYIDWRRRIVGCCYDDVFTASRVFYILALREKPNPLPDKSDLPKFEYEGAYVKEPPLGLENNIAVFDIKMAYPSIIEALNISADTVNFEGKGNKIIVNLDGRPNEIYFDYEKDGLLPKVIKRLKKGRLELKQKIKETTDIEKRKKYIIKDKCYKSVINGMYGVFGSKTFGLYNPYVAGAITSSVKEILIELEKVLAEMEIKIYYIDTDSIYLKVEGIEKAKEIEKTINALIKKYMDYRWKSNSYLEAEFSEFFKWVLFIKTEEEERGSKKNFIGKVIWKNGVECDEIETTGKLLRETTFSKFTVDLQRKIIELIDKGEMNKILPTINEAISQVDKYNLDYIGIPRALHLEEYKRKQPHIRGLEYSMKHFGHPKVQLGTKVKYVYVKNLPDTDVIAWEDISYIPQDKIVWDKEKMLERIVWKPLKNIISAVERQQTKLEEFMEVK